MVYLNGKPQSWVRGVFETLATVPLEQGTQFTAGVILIALF